MPLRVVIAEDEAIIRMDLRETLEEEGYEVIGETGRGDQAVELVRALQPDLAILDIKMPGMDGVQAARIINGEKICGVLMLTAFSQREVDRAGPGCRGARVPRQAVPEERPDPGDRGRDGPVPRAARS